MAAPDILLEITRQAGFLRVADRESRQILIEMPFAYRASPLEAVCQTIIDCLYPGSDMKVLLMERPSLRLERGEG